MYKFVTNFLTKNLPLKILSFILALLMWFYIVNELNKGSQEEVQALRKILQKEYRHNDGKIRR